MAKVLLMQPKNNSTEVTMSKTVSEDLSRRNAYVITGPTSGIGRATALELAKHGTVVLVGRDRKKLDEVQKVIEKKGRQAVPVVCDLSDIASVKNAAREITELGLPIAGLINNAGIYQLHATKNALGWDMTFATNHLGPFALTEALIPTPASGVRRIRLCVSCCSTSFRCSRPTKSTGAARNEPRVRPRRYCSMRPVRLASTTTMAVIRWLAPRRRATQSLRIASLVRPASCCRRFQHKKPEMEFVSPRMGQ
jgi:NAD(P)-dependent dehydrogenase (short-subunit alcohol dehydrogenase family)